MQCKLVNKLNVLCPFFAVEIVVDTLGELGPVCVEAALPSDGVSREKPVGLNRVWPETLAPVNREKNQDLNLMPILSNSTNKKMKSFLFQTCLTKQTQELTKS